MRRRFVSIVGGAGMLVAALSVGCGTGTPAGPVPTLRLVDLFEPGAVSGGAPASRQIPRTEWRFDGDPAQTPRGPAAGTRGWQSGPGVAGLTLRDGRLTGRATNDFPVIHFARTTGFDNLDLVHAVEIRMRASAGGAVWVQGVAGERVDLAQQVTTGRGLPWPFSTTLTAGDEIQTYTITPATHVAGPAMRHLLIRPTDATGATFEIESVRIIYRSEYPVGHSLGHCVAGPERDLPRVAGRALARDDQLRRRSAGSPVAGSRGGHARGCADDVPRQRPAERTGRAARTGARADRDDAAPVGAASDRPRPLGGAARDAGADARRRRAGHARVLGRRR